MKHPINKILAALLGLANFAACQGAEIHDAAKAGDVVRITAILATNSDLVRLGGEDKLTPLHLAARDGKLPAVALLLERGADVNATDVHGCTPLHSAVYGQHTAVAESLLDHGAKVDAARIDGTTPLFYAADHGDTNLLGLLLKRGAKPDAAPAVGFAPLLAAASHGHTNVLEMLAGAGAKLDAADLKGHTALHVAADSGSMGTVAWLLDHGADANALDQFRARPADYVTGATNDALVLLLAQHMTPAKNFLPPTKVGELGDLDRIVLEGLQSFTGQQIRHALAVKPSYLLAAHHQSNLSPFLEELQKMILAGYQSEGFPEAQVDVRFDLRILRAWVTVTEGPRFRAGRIRVAGAKASSSAKLIRWFTTRADFGVLEEKAIANIKDETKRSSEQSWKTSASVGLNNRQGTGLNTPGKATRPDDPIWVKNDPANFSSTWAADAVAQVEACLAEQGFFFPRAKVELQRNTAGTADLLLTIVSEGPPGVIGELTVTGQQLNQAEDILRFLHLRKGSRITAASLAEARRRLNDCGRFRDFSVRPEYPGGEEKVTSRHVNLDIEVTELEGVPRLNKPLSPTQQALVRMCEWLESFPSRDEEIRLAFSHPDELPVVAEFVLSPKRGLLLTAELEGAAPISAGFLIADDTVELCAWSSSNKLAAPRAGGGAFFLHLLPVNSGGSNRFNLSLGGGYSASKGASGKDRPLLSFDVQLSRAAFIDLGTREEAHADVTGGKLVLTNGGFTLRSDAKTGRILGLSRTNDEPSKGLKLGEKIWSEQKSKFMERSAGLSNIYSPGHSFSSFFSIVAGEAARLCLAHGLSVTNNDQQQLAAAAIRRLTNPDILGPMDWIVQDATTNDFSIPMDDMDRAMAMNNVASMLSGLVFDWSTKMFPKYSWPWTAARESTFAMMSQGRYTDVELERLYNSADTGPVGCLVLAKLLTAANSPAAKGFAMQGLVRLNTRGFLDDCDLFLQGESGLAQSFRKLAASLRALPEEELAALVAALPENEASLLRESAAALRAQPEAQLHSVLAPAIGKYWEQSLRAKVHAALYKLTSQPPRTASLPETEQGQEPGI
jgi:ankyrin repeat protein